VKTWSDGYFYEYVIHRGEQVPKIILQNKQPEVRGNGTEVHIPIKDWRDVSRFRQELRTQLRYFSNIKYINCDITNDYQIIRGENFILRLNNGEVVDKELSICLGKVAYPLDKHHFDDFDLYLAHNSQHEFALTFEVGDLPVTMNREAIEYNDAAISAIYAKLIDVGKEFRNLADTNVEVDFIDFLKHGKKSTHITLKDQHISFDIGSFHPGIVQEIKGFPKGLKLTVGALLSEYTITNELSGGRVKKTYMSVKDALVNNYTIYRSANQVYSKRKNLYIEDTESSKPYILIRELGYSTTVAARSMGIENHPDKDRLVDEFRAAVLKEIVQRSKSYEKTEPTQEWIDEYTESLKANRAHKNTEITLRNGNSNINCNYHLVKTTVGDINRYIPTPGFIIYYTQTEENQKHKLPNFNNMGFEVRWFKVAEGNLKHLKGIHRAYHIKEAVEMFAEAKIKSNYGRYFNRVASNVEKSFRNMDSQKGQLLCRALEAYALKYKGSYEEAQPTEPVYFTYKGISYNLTDVAEKLSKLYKSQAFVSAAEFYGHEYFKDDLLPVIKKKILKEHLTTLIY
jgi:hypothetical protein